MSFPRLPGKRMLLHLACLLLVADCAAQDPETVTIVEGLRYPAGIAIQPETETVFVSDSGNGRIVRIDSGSIADVVTGYPVNPLHEDFGFSAGPLGICFLGRTKLAVGTGGWQPGTDRIGIFEIGEDSLNCDDESTSKSIPDSADSPGEEDFFSLALADQAIWSVGRDTQDSGWLSCLTLDNEGNASLNRAIETSNHIPAGSPTAVAISPDGYVVAGIRGPGDQKSTLAFFDQADLDLRAQFELDQPGLIALAYSPHRQRLFALFNSPSAPSQNGLYKLVARQRNTQCEARLIRKMDYPLAMAFLSNGDLMITAGGEDGKVVQVKALDAAVDTPQSPAGNGDQTPQ